MSFVELVKNLGGIAAILMFMGAAVVFLKGSVYKGAIAALESTVNAQESRLETLSINDAEKTITIQRLEAENKVLLSQRPSAELIAELGKMLRSHGDLVRQNHKDQMDILRSLQ